ncbi:hypothetical protein JCM24511_07507 [Saitozyma sp. JCM 24511]|nr:hypothetical protein JCM24511_07507 [Saitozyma sp. JCM 24511]
MLADPESTAGITVAARTSTKGKWQKFVSLIWDSDYYEKSDAERKLVFKLDCALLTCLCFGFLMKYIDQTNLANAYVSGMKEDLNITGNQYTYMTTIYNAVYCVMQIPSNMAVLYVRPSYYLAACELGWAAFTFAQAGARNYQMMYAFRFFVALFEAAFQSVGYFILGSWYTEKELGKRIALVFVAGPAGQAFSGFMQAGIYTSMNGLAGLAGWRWLYIICGIITVPCGLMLIWILPDYPHNTKAFYLTEEERELAIARCARNGTKPITGLVPIPMLKRILRSWHFWLLVPAYLFYATGIQSYNYFTIYLKAANYSVQLRNVLPATSYVLQIPFEFSYGWISDRIGSRFLLCLIPLLWGIFPTGVLAVWPESNGLKVASFMVMGTMFITHVFITWLNEICRDSPEERGFLIASTNTLFFAFNAWLPTVIFLQTDGPSFRKGFPTVFASNIIACVFMVVIWRFHKRQQRQEATTLRMTEEEGVAGMESGKVDDGDGEGKVVVDGEGEKNVAVVSTLLA